jgi:hypothetical protein
MGGGNEEEISPSDESNSVSHFVTIHLFKFMGGGNEKEISPGDESKIS